MLVDEVKLQIKGGNGGDGCSSFKNPKMSRGPTGGDGGKGGSVFLEGVSDLSALRQFRHQQRYSAGNGQPGSNRNKHGADGDDLILKVPVGTIAHNQDLNRDYEVSKVGEKILIAYGGAGGRGNFYFRSSTNISPTEFERGNKARQFDFFFELKLIADVGLIGLPNAGKSSLLNELTKARSRVANYRFTTLEPHLGAYYDLVLADIPGLIEGASQGKGLGDKFLRHISRCRLLFHLIAADSSDLKRDYEVIRKELGDYDKELLEKDEYLVLAKSDLISEKQKKQMLTQLKKLNPKCFAISVFDWESLDGVKKILNAIAREKNA